MGNILPVVPQLRPNNERFQPKFLMVQPLGYAIPVIDSNCTPGSPTYDCIGYKAYLKLPSGLMSEVERIIRGHHADVARYGKDMRIHIGLLGPEREIDKFKRGCIFEDSSSLGLIDKANIMIGTQDVLGTVGLVLLDASNPNGLEEITPYLHCTVPLFEQQTTHRHLTIRVLAVVTTDTEVEVERRLQSITTDRAQQFATDNNMVYFEGSPLEILQSIIALKRSNLPCYYCQLMSIIGSCPNKTDPNCAFCRSSVVG